MTLHEYIQQHGVRDLAKKIGANALYLRQIGWGKANPSFVMANKIVEATGGKVSFNDLAKNISQ